MLRFYILDLINPAVKERIYSDWAPKNKSQIPLPPLWGRVERGGIWDLPFGILLLEWKIIHWFGDIIR